MHHPFQPLPHREIAFTMGVIGLGLLPIAMAIAALFVSWPNSTDS